MLRTGAEDSSDDDNPFTGYIKGDQYDNQGNITRFGDIPSPSAADLEEVDNKFNDVVDGLPKWAQTALKNRDTNKILEDENTRQYIASTAYDWLIQGSASNVVKARELLKRFGFPESEMEQSGAGYGHVYSSTSYTGDEIPPEVRNIINKGTTKKESFNGSGLRKVKFVMKEIADAPVSAAPTNTQTTSQQPTESKETADALAKEYIEKNGPDKTQELINQTDEYLSAHGAGAEPSPHAQSDVDKETMDQEVESDIDNNSEMNNKEKEEYKKLVALINSEGTDWEGKDYHEFDSNQVQDIKLANNWAIARSLILNRVTEHTYPQAWINEYISGISYHNLIFPDTHIKNFIPIVDDELGYADDNIYVQNGTVMNNTSETHQQTKHASLANEAFFGGVGEGMSQIVIPKDGGVPYLKFKDYNYHNLRSADPSEIPGGGETDLGSRISFVITSLQSGAAHALGALSDLVTYGKNMKSLGSGWPEGIHGAAYTEFEVKLNQMSPYLQNMIKSHPLYWTDGRYEELFDDKEAFENEMGRIVKVMNDDNKTKGFVKKYTDELWKMDADDKHIGSNPEINDVLNRFNTEYFGYEDEIKKVQDDFWRGGPNNRGVHGDLTQEWMDQWESWKTDRPKYEDWDGYKEDQRLTDEFRKYHKSVGGTIDADGTYRASLPRKEAKIWQEKFDAFNMGTMAVMDRFNETVSWPYDEEVFAKLDEIKKRQNDARESYEKEFNRLHDEQDALLPKFTEEWNPVWEAHQREQLKLYHSTYFGEVHNSISKESWEPGEAEPKYNPYKRKDPFSIGAGTPGGIGGTGDAATAADLAGERKRRRRNRGASIVPEVYKPKGRRLQESDLDLSRRQVRMLKEIKKPVLVEELPQQKLSKYKPNFKGKYSPQNTPDKTASKESDALVMSGNQKGQAWRTQDKYWSGYESQERMNIIQDRVGHGEMAWDMIIDEARRKNGWKNREIQEQLNQIAAEKGMKEQVPDYESPFGYVIHEQGASTEEELDTVMKDPAVKVKHPFVKNLAKRLKGQIDYKDKPSRQGFPDEPPAKQQDGWHPEYGKKYKYDKLDPQSAEAMPPTGNPEIDANVEKAKPKKPRWKHINTESKVDPKVKWQESVDWRNEIEINNSESLIEVENLDDFYERKQKLNERMTTSSVFSYSLAGSDADHVVVQTGYTGDGDINDFTHGDAHTQAVHHGGEFTAFTSFTDCANVDDPQDMGKSVRNFTGQDADGNYDLSPSISDHPTGTGDGTPFWPGDTGGLRGTHFYQNYGTFPYTASGFATNEDAVGFEEPDEPQEGILERLGSAMLVGTGFAGNAGVPRLLAMKPVDTTEMDTFSLNWFTLGLIVTDMNHDRWSYGMKFARDDFRVTGQGDGVYLYYWAGDKPGAKIYGPQMNGWGTATRNYSGWRPINRKWDGTLDPDVDPHIIPNKPNPVDENGDRLTKGDNYMYRGPYRGQTYFNNKLTLPEWCRGKNMRFMLVQKLMSQGAAYNRWGLTSIRFQRRAPMTVVAPLDSPEATAFIRDGSLGKEETTPQKRKKKVDKILKASKEYVNKIVADPFPGTEAEIGEAQGTSGNEYVPQAWDNKKQEFADSGTLDQQKDKFVSKDVKLPPTYSQVQKAKKKK